jgi:hypothetical protein
MDIVKLLKSLLFSILGRKQSSKSDIPPQQPVSEETLEAVRLADEARKRAENARRQAEKAKAEAEKAKVGARLTAEEARLDAQIEALKATLPKRPQNRKECEDRYGPVTRENNKITWKNEAKHCAILSIPEDIASKWINTATGKPTLRIYSNRDIHKPLILALLLLKKRGLLDELKTFDGCYNPRLVRGGSSPSYHSWGIAIDLNAKENPLNAKPVLSKEFVRCWEEAGWVWGGNWSRPDGQHFQYVKEG